jgi:hypothetical protein
MAVRSRTSFQKRQKEIARMEKQREKVARRLQRKQLGEPPASDGTSLDDQAIRTDTPSAVAE